ncbi:MAG: ABC transporter ATP-binding protein [Clostridia bacterium]|nr:ABC transporter ATP-binding protein [Clostridia bacterium]
MSLLELDHISKNFGEGDVLSDLCLSVEEGEFLTLLGPSGCGKTTTLRIIAGLESPTQGRVMLDGQDITHLPPEKRTVNTVFQSYALFPHMNVEKNIAYGLRLRGVSKKEAAKQASQMLEMVALPGFEKRMPQQLSGGQRQRVAIARALVLKPRILLLDEPLGALDLQLRRYMQTELKNLQRQAGTTFIYITHDQEEAMNMSHRVGIMHKGRLEDLDTPQQIYAHPKTLFSAQFIGQANLLKGVAENGVFTVDGLTIPCPGRHSGPAALCLRPEHLHPSRRAPEGFHLTGQVTDQRFSGGVHRLVVTLPTGQEIMCLSHEEELALGDTVHLAWDPARAALVPWEAEA